MQTFCQLQKCFLWVLENGDQMMTKVNKCIYLRPMIEIIKSWIVSPIDEFVIMIATSHVMTH